MTFVNNMQIATNKVLPFVMINKMRISYYYG